MELDTKFKVFITSTTLIVGSASFVYLISKFNKRCRNAIDALNYLTIVTVTKESECNIVVGELRRRCKFHRAVGFDCEWVTEHGKKRPVALVQLSTFDGYCGLFRLNLLQTVPNSLKELLNDVNIYKVGVAPSDDAKYLQADYNINLKSTLDVRHLAVLCRHHPGGLGSLSKSLLNIILDKSWRVRCSNWEADTLTDAQVKYAAADAHVAIKIFVKLIDKLNKPSKWSMLLGTKGSKDVWNNLDDVCMKFADFYFKVSHALRGIDAVNNPKRIKEVSKTYSNLTRTKPLYHNCFLQAPDGELLCTCDNKKALWYVQKQLADVVTEEPLTVRLRFEPAGRSVGEVGRYYQLTKENKCVVCGNNNSYIRKNVVPREYRKYFPDIMKDHSSHDVLLLCAPCHQRSNVTDQRVRDQLASLCAAPLCNRDSSKYVEDSMQKKARSAARALLNPFATLPAWRRTELERLLLHYYQHDEITTELLQEAADLQVLFENQDYESHGLKVVEFFLEGEGGLLALEEMWRKHFLRSMQPKYMPELWSTKHNEERLRVKYNEGRLNEEQLKAIGVTVSDFSEQYEVIPFGNSN
ncbi:exonuclease 3'-5' domain-containing protein 2 [Achroia grisella]|uniref:exonuclease 3'-5' domain-containing protein 2 n=1 Tax=Achroia grisella TaxID=688607 RepID=UPI0027D29929|nr:exonuclease 3'-5' domain-containing protein 2 [Achroia grisella]